MGFLRYNGDFSKHFSVLFPDLSEEAQHGMEARRARCILPITGVRRRALRAASRKSVLWGGALRTPPPTTSAIAARKNYWILHSGKLVLANRCWLKLQFQSL